jgi:hypothetical protein
VARARLQLRAPQHRLAFTIAAVSRLFTSPVGTWFFHTCHVIVPLLSSVPLL